MSDLDDPRPVQPAASSAETPVDPATETPTEIPTGSAELEERRGEGPAAAATLAVGIGALTLGLLTTVAEASETVSDWLTFNDRVGPLSGKVTVTVIVWLVSWAVLHLTLRKRDTMSRGLLVTSGVMIGLGLLGTFPIFFQLFE